MSRARAAAVAVLVALAAAAALAAFGSGSSGAPVPLRAGVPVVWVDEASRGGPCDDGRAGALIGERTPLCSLEAAAALVADGGRVVVRKGTYPRLTLRRRFEERTTFAGHRSERPALRGLTVPPGTGGARFEGFALRDATVVEGTAVELVRNDVHPHGIVLRGDGHLVAGNDIHDLRMVFDARRSLDDRRCHSQWQGSSVPLTTTGGIAPRCGYALRVQGSRHVIRGNRIARIPADGIQLRDARDVRIAGNAFSDIEPFLDPLEHSDGIQVIGDNRRVTIDGNTFRDTRGILSMVFPDPDPAKVTYARDLRITGNDMLATRDLLEGGNGCLSLSAGVGVVVEGNSCATENGVSPGGGIRLWRAGGAGRLEVSVTGNETEELRVETTEGVREDANRVGRYVVSPGVAFTPGPRSVVTGRR